MARRIAAVFGALAMAGLSARAVAEDATVAVTVEPGARVGRPVAIDIRFQVPSGSHISPDAPLSIRLSGPPAVTIDKPVLHYGDAVPPPGAAPHFVAHATSTLAGEQEIRVAMTYYVCTADLCDMHRKSETLHLRAR